MSKEFKTIGDIVTDEKFIGYVKEEISRLKIERSMYEPKPGFRIKRNWFDRMTEENSLNAYFFIENIGLVLAKQSTLCAEYRSALVQVCGVAYKKAIKEYSEGLLSEN